MKMVACLALLSHLAACTRSEVHDRQDASAPESSSSAPESSSSAPESSSSTPQVEPRDDGSAGAAGMAMSKAKAKPAGAAAPASAASEFDVDAGAPGSSAPMGQRSCIHDGACRELDTRVTDAVDLLFMVDNSNSMAGEQASLKSQFPTLIRMLTSGVRTPGDPHPFQAVRSLHVGVVSSDMGLAGVEFAACHADGGDDGRLQHSPRGVECVSGYPSFLSYDVNQPNDPAKLAEDVGCIATLGTGGCGFEQQLEAPLKALWPSVYRDAQGVMRDNPVSFLATTEQGKLGHGDVPAAMGGSQGFLQPDRGLGPSLLVVVVVTDEEDCSVRSNEHLWPNSRLSQDSPYLQEDINLRCMKHPEFLYDVQARYYTYFRALRPGHEDLVVFAAIAGVPPDLVDTAALSTADLSSSAGRDGFYAKILGDPRMQEVIDETTNPGMGTGNVKPSCSRQVAGETLPSTAYPPRRIVQLAKLFGENGIVQSICQDDFSTSTRAIVDVVANRLGQDCSLEKLPRTGSKLDCDLIWELPAVATDTEQLIDCNQRPFLEQAQAPRSARNARGGRNCVAQQVSVSDPSSGAPPPGEGWFYDDFTHEGAVACRRSSFQRIAFTRGAQPSAGVKVVLDCQPGVFP